jgi:hypothetical protein
MGTRTDYSSKFLSYLQQEKELEIRPIRLPSYLDITPDFYQDELFQTCRDSEDHDESGLVFDFSIQDDSKLGTFRSLALCKPINNPGDLSKDVHIDVKLVPLAENSPRFPSEVPGTSGKFGIPSVFKKYSDYDESENIIRAEMKRESDSYLKGNSATDISNSRSTPTRIIQFSSDKMERKEEASLVKRLSTNQLMPIKNEKYSGLLVKSDIRESRSSDQFSSGGSTNFKSPASKYQLTGEFLQRSPSSEISSPGMGKGKTVEMRAKQPRRILISSESEKSFNTDRMVSINLSRGNSIQDPENALNSPNSQNKSQGGLNSLLSKSKVGSNRSGGSSRSSSASITLKEHRRRLQIDKPVSKFRSLSPEKIVQFDENPLVEKSIESSESEEVRNPPKLGGRGLVKLHTDTKTMKTETSKEERSELISPSKSLTIVKKVSLNLRVPNNPIDKSESKPAQAEIPSDKLAASIQEDLDINTLDTDKDAKKTLQFEKNHEIDSLGEIPEVTDSSMSKEYTSRMRYNSKISLRSENHSFRYEESPRNSTRTKSKLAERPDIESVSTYESHMEKNIRPSIGKRKHHKHRRSNFSQDELLKEPLSFRGDSQVHRVMIDRSRQISDGLCDTESDELRESELFYNIAPQTEEDKAPKTHKKKRKHKQYLEEVSIPISSIESPPKSKRESKKNKRKKHADKLDTQDNLQETYDVEPSQINLSNSPISTLSYDSNQITEPPARSFSELFNRLNQIEIPKSNTPQRSEKSDNRPFLQKLFGCCIGVKSKPYNPQENVMSLIHFCSTITFDDTNSQHLFLLSTLFSQLSSPADFIPRISEDWIKLGFSSTNPVSDLTHSSLLSLINLTFFSLSLTTQLNFILQTSKSRGSHFELLSTSFSISSHAYSTFKSGALNSLIKSSDPWYIQNLYYTGVFLWWFNLYMTKSKIYTPQALFIKTFEHASKRPQDMISLCKSKMNQADNN